MGDAGHRGSRCFFPAAPTPLVLTLSKGCPSGYGARAGQGLERLTLMARSIGMVKTYELILHPDCISTGVIRVSVDVWRMPNGCIDLEFDIHGPLAGSIAEEPQDAIFTDELWRGTCFEAFLTADDNAGYIELNFTAAGLWAAYKFDKYRQGMQRLPEADMVAGVSCNWSQAVSISTEARLKTLPDHLPWAANLAAIIEAKDGTKSYWALAHAPGPPDFHNRDCFIATLPAPTPP